jgi:hypothetical protein
MEIHKKTTETITINPDELREILRENFCDKGVMVDKIVFVVEEMGMEFDYQLTAVSLSRTTESTETI